MKRFEIPCFSRRNGLGKNFSDGKGEKDGMDGKIRKTLSEIGEAVEAPESLKRQIDCRIAAEGREILKKKKTGVKKVIVTTAAACLLVGTVCLAVGGSYLRSGRSKSYDGFSDLQKAEREVGYGVDAVESFSNGYRCKKMSADETVRENMDGSKESVMGFRFHYSGPGENKKVTLAARRLLPGENEGNIGGEKTPDKTMLCSDIKVYHYTTTMKCVPEDYELTEEDRSNLKRTDYEISVGSDEVEVEVYQSVLWIRDGVVYDLFGFELPLTADQILGMAKEIIESRTE